MSGYSGDDPLLTLAELRETGEAPLSPAAIWRGVRNGDYPAPFYVAPRKPVWRLSEWRAAVAAKPAMPRDQMAARRAAKLQRATEDAP